MKIRPIETRYKGYRFRSRLEARWAVFFDASGIAWEYEKEGYDLGELSWYLPDFWLPSVRLSFGKYLSSPGCWIEIKPKYDETALQKLRRLALLTSAPACLFYGLPDDPIESWDHQRECFSSSGVPALEKPDSVCFAACLNCGQVFIQELHLANSFACCQYSDVLDTTPLIRQAQEAAKSARFEHGE